MNTEELEELANELNTQNNLATQDPIYIVFEKEKILGIDSSYADDYCWATEDYECIVDQKDCTESDDKMEADGYHKMYYKIKDGFVNAHFTRKAAQRYIDNNSHRHSYDLYIFVNSMFRCPEMIAIREFLMKDKSNEDNTG